MTFVLSKAFFLIRKNNIQHIISLNTLRQIIILPISYLTPHISNNTRKHHAYFIMPQNDIHLSTDDRTSNNGFLSTFRHQRVKKLKQTKFNFNYNILLNYKKILVLIVLIRRQIGQTVSFVVSSTSLSRQSRQNTWPHSSELGSKSSPRQTLQPGDCSVFAESTATVLLAPLENLSRYSIGWTSPPSSSAASSRRNSSESACPLRRLAISTPEIDLRISNSFRTHWSWICSMKNQGFGWGPLIVLFRNA